MSFNDEVATVHEIVDRESKVQDFSLLERRGAPPAFLRSLASKNREVVQWGLGDTGVRLYDFATLVHDSDHPDLGALFGNSLGEKTEFVTNAQEMLSLASLASDNNLNNVLAKLSRLVPKFDGFEAFKSLDSPRKTLNHVRFIKDPDVRFEIRSAKKMSAINIQGILQKGTEAWSQCSKTFAGFSRNQTPFAEDLEVCRRRAKMLVEIGCPAIATKLKDRMVQFESYIKERYYGFNRMTIQNASIIVGKVFGCELQSTLHSNTFKVSIAQEVYKEVFERIGATPMSVKSSGGSVSYEPRLYPYYVHADIAPPRMIELIALLESFPEAGYQPIFDHFWVMVPTFSVLNIPANQHHRDQHLSDIVDWFDRLILRERAVPAIMLGEKDGRCFFVDYWV